MLQFRLEFHLFPADPKPQAIHLVLPSQCFPLVLSHRLTLMHLLDLEDPSYQLDQLHQPHLCPQ